MTEVHRNRDGIIDMYPDETAAQLSRLRAAGVDLDAAWQGNRGRIDYPGRVGGGPMGTAFTNHYGEPKKAVVDAMAQISGVYQRLADNGDQAVRVYEAADGAAAGQFLR